MKYHTLLISICAVTLIIIYIINHLHHNGPSLKIGNVNQSFLKSSSKGEFIRHVNNSDRFSKGDVNSSIIHDTWRRSSFILPSKNWKALHSGLRPWKIGFYPKHFAVADSLFEKHGPCSNTCKYSRDTGSDILIFDSGHLYGKPPVRKNANQVWVFQATESPDITYSKVWRQEEWRNQFNRTLSYRIDSDLVMPYGMYRKRPVSAAKNFTEIMKIKSKLVAIVASNCRSASSQRQKYVKLLQKYIPVDFYGKCGNLSIDKVGGSFANIATKYKFYLSFENSLCEDYASEKFFGTESEDIVAVVRSGAKYDMIAPRKTYINTSDYKSVKDLAEYLLYLDKNDTAYVQYLEQKLEYECSTWCGYWNNNSPLPLQLKYCSLCDKVQEWMGQKKVYDNISAWYEKAKCHKPKDLH